MKLISTLSKLEHAHEKLNIMQFSHDVHELTISKVTVNRRSSMYFLKAEGGEFDLIKLSESDYSNKFENIHSKTRLA